MFVCYFVLCYFTQHAEVEWEWMGENLVFFNKQYKARKYTKVKQAERTVEFLKNFQKEYIKVCIIKALASTLFLSCFWYIRYRNDNGINNDQYDEIKEIDC